MLPRYYYYYYHHHHNQCLNLMYGSIQLSTVCAVRFSDLVCCSTVNTNTTKKAKNLAVL
jgi:hypothetical protein